jgi:hypothetical protein
MPDIVVTRRRKSTVGGTTGTSTVSGVSLKSSTPGPVGPQGPQGETGWQGIPGDRGFDAGIGYLFNASTENTNPGVGRISFNHGTIASVTAIYINTVDAFENDLTNWINSWDATTGSIRGTLILKENNTGQVAIFNITGDLTWDEADSSAVDSSGSVEYGRWIIPVEYVAGTIFSNMNLCMIMFIPMGGVAADAAFQTASFAATINIDCTTYKDWICTVEDECVINIINASDGDAGMLEVIVEAGSSGDSSEAILSITLGAAFTKQMGLTELDCEVGADNIISWRKVGTDIVYTIAQIVV